MGLVTPPELTISIILKTLHLLLFDPLIKKGGLIPPAKFRAPSIPYRHVTGIKIVHTLCYNQGVEETLLPCLLGKFKVVFPHINLIVFVS